MKTFAALCVSLLPSLAHAITVLPAVSVEDPSKCVSTAALTEELSAILPAGRDHHAYAVGVLVQASRDPDSAQLLLTVENADNKAASLERTLTVKRGECADATRMLARIAAKAMEGAPQSDGSGGPGVRGARPAEDAPRPTSNVFGPAVPERMPDEWLHFQREVVVTVNSNRYGSSASVNEFEVPVMGPYAKKLEWEEFYQKVGRDDLAATYHSRWIRRNVLYWGGVGVAVVSGVVGAVVGAVAGVGAMGLMFYGLRNANSPGGLSSPASPALWGIIGLVAAPILAVLLTLIPVGAGVAMTWVGVLLPLQPVELHEVKELADEHNQKLGSGGVEGTDIPATAPKARPAPVPGETRT